MEARPRCCDVNSQTPVNLDDSPAGGVVTVVAGLARIGRSTYWAVAFAASDGGSKTVSMTWMMPLLAMMSGVVTVASLT
jgi:predicted phage tail protein